MEPFFLPPNQLHRFYRGGSRIADLRRSGSDDAYAPEEWIASMASPFGEPGAGVSVLADGTLLTDLVAANPQAYLGQRHVDCFGPDVAVLIKLLDAGERLPVHFHPDDEFAGAHLGSRYGKTEAWIILDAFPDAAVHVGFAQRVDDDVLREWIRDQDADALLGSLREIRVRPGDTVYVPAGTPHAIGEGVLLAELQQPTDFSILLEWERFAENSDAAFLGLGVDLVMAALDRAVWDDEVVTIAKSSRTKGNPPGTVTLFPASADPFFRAQRIKPAPTPIEQSFSVLLVIAGNVTLIGDGWKLDARRGDAILVPYSAGDGMLAGEGEVLRCMAPDPGLR